MSLALLAAVACSERTLSLSEVSEGGAKVINASADALPGQVLVKLSPDACLTTKSAGSTTSIVGNGELDRLLMGMGTVRFERLFPDGRFASRTHEAGLDRWFYAVFDPEIPARTFAQALKDCEGVEVIEGTLDVKTSDCGPSRVSASSYNDYVRNSDFPFNESLHSQRMQWHYNNTGSVFAVKTMMGADANVYPAWKLCTGDPDVIVAVIDQGVKYDHEDLAANMWVNPGEIPGNGIDDDGNGYVDDIYGYNFVDDNGQITFSHDNDHATHVAGTIAAVNNNGIGVNGIAGGSGKGDGVRIMTLETLGQSASGTSGSGVVGQVRAMKYAADNGAVISQNSWGYSAGAIKRGEWEHSAYSAISEAIGYFIKYAGMDENGNQVGPMAGGIVIFAAGNDASEEISYPASDPQVVSVTATSFNGTPSSFSNYGRWTSLGAPGGDLTLSTSYGGIYSTDIDEDGNSAYGSMQGTSMACPHVSGACALAVSYYWGSGKNRGLTPEKLRQALLSSTREFLPWGGDHDFKMGAGSLDTYKLLRTIRLMDDIPGMSLAAGASEEVDLTAYFLDTDAFTVRSSDSKVATATVSKAVLVIKAVGKGTADITVTDGSAIAKVIKVEVK